MKKIVMFLISLYLTFVCLYGYFLINSEKHPFIREMLPWAALVFGVLFFVLYIINIICGIKDFSTKDIFNLRKSMMILKFGTVPFLVLNFHIILATTIMSGLFTWITLGVSLLVPPLMIGLGVITGVMILSLSSLYSILFLIRLKRINAMTKGEMSIHIILQLFCLVDVIGVLVLAIRYSNKKCVSLFGDPQGIIVQAISAGSESTNSESIKVEPKSKIHIKKIIFFLIGLYLNLICFCLIFTIEAIFKDTSFSDKTLLYLNIIIIIWLVLGVFTLVLYIINIIFAFIDFLNKDIVFFRKAMILMKFGTIPFFIVSFVIFVWALLSVGFVTMITLGLGVFMIPIVLGIGGTVFTLVLALTSLYSILFLIRLKRLNGIEKGGLIIHIILQLIFILDDIGALILAIKYSKKKCLELSPQTKTVVVSGNELNGD